MALDYSQIELRAVAELISDWFGATAYCGSRLLMVLDAHTATAMSMTGKASPRYHQRERQLAKPCNFGLLYLMGNRGFYRYLRINFVPNITFEEACELRARFFDGYPDMEQWQTSMRVTPVSKASLKQSPVGDGAGNGGLQIRRTSTKTRRFMERVIVVSRLVCRQSSGPR